MNYKELSEEYLSQYKLLSHYIKNLKLKARTMEELSLDKELARRVSLLYSICLDLKHVGEYLKRCERRDSH